jgi:hypothetical protein
MVSGKSPHDPLRALAATKSGKGSKGAKDKDKPKAKGEEKPSTKCDFCGRTNHCVSTCYQYKEAQTAALAATAEKAKRSPGPRKGTTMIAKSYKPPNSDDDDEEQYLANEHIRSHSASMLASSAKEDEGQGLGDRPRHWSKRLTVHQRLTRNGYP